MALCLVEWLEWLDVWMALEHEALETGFAHTPGPDGPVVLCRMHV